MKQRRLTHKEKSELLTKYETGKFTAVDLAKEYPVSSTAINRLLRRHGYKAKSQSELQRKYNIDETFFDVINTEEKAYFLGFLYADGYNNTDRSSVALSLKEDDKEILIRLNSLLQPTKPLGYYKKNKLKRGFENSQNEYRLVIANKHISERLVELGCGKAKTHNLKFPTEEQVPSHLIRHFVRGYFDGDGSVSGDKQKQFSFVGTIDFLLPLQQILVKELNFSKTKLDQRHEDREDSIRALRYCGINQCITFRDWLYKDATIYLERKKNIFDSCISFERVERKCSVDGCGKKHFGNGYCKNHYYEFCGGREKRRERFKTTGK